MINQKHRTQHADLRGKPFKAKGKTTGTSQSRLHYFWRILQEHCIDGGGLQDDDRPKNPKPPATGLRYTPNPAISNEIWITIQHST
jgi:hypothetical protein